jgi:hypothetical protein
MARPEPVLRCLHDVRAVSAMLGRALGAPSAQSAATDLPATAPRPVRTLTPSTA